MRWDFFHRPETGPNPRDNDCYAYTFELDADTSIEAAMAHAYANGLPRGSHRCGCVEVQNDRGIWSQKEGNRIDVSTPRKRAKVIFRTWEELEAEC